MRNSLTRSLMGAGSSSYNGPEISLEEEVILAGQQGEDIAEADATMDEIASIQNRADNLTDHADFVEGQVTEATPTEMALSEQTMAANLEGTGAEVEDVAPALESAIGSRPSMEGVREMVRSFWEAVKRAVKKVWEKIKGYWRKMTSRVSSLEKSAKELRTKAQSVSGKSVKSDDKKFSVSGSTVTLLSAGTAAKKASDFMSDFGKMMKANSALTTAWAAKVDTGSNNLITKLQDFDEENGPGSLVALNGAAATLQNDLKGIVTSALSMSGTSGDDRFNGADRTVTKSDQLLGQKALFMVVASAAGTNDEGHAKEYADNIQLFDVFLSSYTSKDEKEFDDVEFETMSHSDAIKVADAVIDMCSEMRYYETGKGVSKLEKVRDKLEKAGDKLSKSVERTDNGDDADKASASRTAIYAAMRYATVVTRWSKNPNMSFSNHCASVARAAISVANRSMSQYH